MKFLLGTQMMQIKKILNSEPQSTRKFAEKDWKNICGYLRKSAS